jgi:hypothetical protein
LKEAEIQKHFFFFKSPKDYCMKQRSVFRVIPDSANRSSLLMDFHCCWTFCYILHVTSNKACFIKILFHQKENFHGIDRILSVTTMSSTDCFRLSSLKHCSWHRKQAGLLRLPWVALGKFLSLSQSHFTPCLDEEKCLSKLFWGNMR